jgi:putative peptidoglycan lipid II flippase
VVGGWTLVSRLLGLVREIFLAGWFGTGLAMSSFAVAFMIPNLFRRLFGEGALSAAFVPVFIDTRTNEGDEAARFLFRRAMTLLVLVLTGITLVGWLVIFIMLRWASPDSSTWAICALLRIMLPYMIFICLAALSMAALNARQHFAVPAFTPSLLSIVMILTLVFIVPRASGGVMDHMRIVAWAVLLAGVLQWAAQIPVLHRFGLAPGWSGDLRDPRLHRVLLLMGPAAVGLAVAQINVMIDKFLALAVGPSAPAALYYSERLIYLPLGVFATAMSLVLLPALSGHAANREENAIPPAINHALRNLLFVMVPASVGILVLARPLVAMVFEWGEFDAESTTMTARALAFYAPGLVMFSLGKVFVPAFYARGDTRTPVRIAVWAVGVNLALNLLFIVTWPQGWKHAGLACATVISSAFNGTWLAVLIHRQLGSPGWRAIGASALRSLVAAGLMAVAVVRVHRWGSNLADGAKAYHILAVLAAVVAGVVVYLVLAALLKAPELQEWRNGMRREREPAS